MPRVVLQELYAQRIGVIDEAKVQFGPHFNVITGETGAGKTLLLGALELCLGSDGATSRQAVTSESRAVALFDIDGDERLFVRESTANGRLRAALDGAPASADALRASARDVIVIHGQHDSLTLKNRSEIAHLLDNVGAISTARLEELRTEIRSREQRRSALGGDTATREREIDYLRFQLDEIDATAIESPDELRQMLDELTALTAFAEAQAAMVAVADGFDGEDDAAVLNGFARLLQELPSNDQLADIAARLRDALEGARDAVGELRRRSDPDQINPAAIDTLNERAARLQAIARKYGGSLGAALAHREQCATALDTLVHAADELESLDERIATLRVDELDEARRVRREREFAAVTLTERVRKQLPRVALPNASLRFDVDGVDGSEAQILFTPNPGLPEGPLQNLASGGELSRVLLALSLEADNDHLVTVFDEVDAGVGGQVAQQIGACLAEVGQQQQVIAVTHLASVAARAQHHFVIEKSVVYGRTSTTVRPVSGEERVSEIARMLAGDATSGEALALAARMLELA